jgi:hypothetical protein
MLRAPEGGLWGYGRGHCPATATWIVANAYVARVEGHWLHTPQLRVLETCGFC